MYFANCCLNKLRGARSQTVTVREATVREQLKQSIVQLSVRAQPHLPHLDLAWIHTPSTAFRHLPPNSARFGYAAEGVLFISAQLSTDAFSALRKVCMGTYNYDCGSSLTPKHPRKQETHSFRVKERVKFRLDSNDCGFICAGVNFVGGYK